MANQISLEGFYLTEAVQLIKLKMQMERDMEELRQGREFWLEIEKERSCGHSKTQKWQ